MNTFDGAFSASAVHQFTVTPQRYIEYCGHHYTSFLWFVCLWCLSGVLQGTTYTHLPAIVNNSLRLALPCTLHDLPRLEIKSCLRDLTYSDRRCA